MESHDNLGPEVLRIKIIIFVHVATKQFYALVKIIQFVSPQNMFTLERE